MTSIFPPSKLRRRKYIKTGSIFRSYYVERVCRNNVYFFPIDIMSKKLSKQRGSFVHCSRSRKTIILLNLLKQQDDDNYSIINKIYLCVKDPYLAKYQHLIQKLENNGLKNLKDPKAFIEYSNNMQDVYKNIEEYDPNRKCNTLMI